MHPDRYAMHSSTSKNREWGSTAVWLWSHCKQLGVVVQAALELPTLPASLLCKLPLHSKRHGLGKDAKADDNNLKTGGCPSDKFLQAPSTHACLPARATFFLCAEVSEPPRTMFA